MIQLPKGKNLEGVLICSSNFIFCHYTVNHPSDDHLAEQAHTLGSKTCPTSSF